MCLPAKDLSVSVPGVVVVGRVQYREGITPGTEAPNLLMAKVLTCTEGPHRVGTGQYRSVQRGGAQPTKSPPACTWPGRVGCDWWRTLQTGRAGQPGIDEDHRVLGKVGQGQPGLLQVALLVPLHRRIHR